MQGPGGAPPQHPVDRGWAWMVCLGSFGLNFFVNGGLRSMGVLFIELRLKYQAEDSLTSLTVSVLAGGFAIFSAVGNAVGAIKTMRTACMFGSIMMFLGMFLTCFAPNIYLVILCLGLISGIGYGFVYGPSMVMVNQYFVRRRSLANGLAAAGGSVGTLVLPLFIRNSTEHFGFTGTVLIYSAIILHAIPASMLLRPVAFYNRKSKLPGPAQPAPQPSLPEIVVSRPESQEEKSKPDARYELVGSKIISLSDNDSVESLPNVIKFPASAAPVAPAPVAAAPMGPPPKMTLGLFLRMFFQKLCDKEVLSMWAYIAYVVGLSIGHGGYINLSTYLPPYGFEVWKSRDIASYMIVILGISDLVGRVSGGWFADLGLVRKPFIIGFSFVVAGAATIVFPFYPTIPSMIVYIVVLGLLGGTYLAQMVVIVAELVGPAKTPSALGFSTLIMGLMIIPLIPLLSKIALATGTFASAVQLAGVLLVIGGILFYLIPLLEKLQKKKIAKEASKKSNTTAAESEL